MGYEKRKEMGQKPDPTKVKAKGEEKKMPVAKKMAAAKKMVSKKKM
ncbi:hypothetical protein UFOVP135_34 [uncultured Caudovirales phage]|uniref:Uncharacterized protein n=1 Tax=uncultured Caudovirales phage TaxID=2100421 RepID=A0A6J5LCE6_9CAUD|nr:hypothetical protein UFOVP135_34 [uncultured Caudovirales phage]